MKRISGYVVVTIIIVLGGVWVAAQVDLTSFQPDTVIRAEEVNANFEALRTAVESVVTSLNGKSGSVDIEAGSNVSVDDSQDGKIVISAVAGGSGAGDITEVVAGDGLEGGGASGAVTLSAADSLARDAEIVPTVLANDGSGSGLDADTLDGLDSSDLALSGHTHATLPTAFGRVTDFEGNAGSPSIAGGSGNFTVSYNDVNEWYAISFDGISYSTADLAVVTPATGTGDVRIASVGSVSGQLLVFIRDLTGTDIRDSFHFVAYAD